MENLLSVAISLNWNSELYLIKCTLSVSVYLLQNASKTMLFLVNSYSSAVTVMELLVALE